ncbi:MAG TPA: HAMP domain-containing sensor histidine kinase [Acidimicrobiales bacterium]|nr:HAMP domain-containing sensor histidine kinase [Acidimicrobiales bacterium]
MSLRPTSVWRRTPLWLRLITTVLALSIVALTVMGVFGARLLRGYLVERADDQLVEAAGQARDVFNGALENDPMSDERRLPSQYHFTLQDDAGATVGETPSKLFDAPPPDLPALTPADAADRGGHPFTVDATRGHGSWRAVAVPIASGSGTIITAASLGDVDATVHRLSTINLLVGGAVIAGLALAAYTMVRTALRPLTKIEQTAAAIAGGDLSRRVDDDDPNTEVGRLGLALNTMLEQIETAFHARQASEATARRSEEKMRRFVADASHELRTPLTSIRGFAELHRQGAVTDPAEVSRLLNRIEDEAKRMGLLVDDLLLLARLDQQRPFEHAPVDLRVLAIDAVEAARATAPDREIRVDVPVDDDADGELFVAGDEPRLRQVLSNLLDNALAYSPADAPITVLGGRTRRDGRDLAFVQVRDRGPGLAPEQAERVFERFYRTDRARSRARGGTGLGLSIVAAITAAHGGTVELDTAPGEGATFRILLPRLSETPSAPPSDVPPAGLADELGSGEPSLRS